MKKKKPYIVLLRGVMPTGKNRIPKIDPALKLQKRFLNL